MFAVKTVNINMRIHKKKGHFTLKIHRIKRRWAFNVPQWKLSVEFFMKDTFDSYFLRFWYKMSEKNN